MKPRMSWLWLAAIGIILFGASPARAYIGGPPATLGLMCAWSTHIILVKVEKIDKDKNVIVFRKQRDVKGKWPADVVRQNIGSGAAERQHIMQWAEVGKTTMIFALESYKWSHTYIDSLWYASNTADWQWWNMSHVEPILLRGFSGKQEKLIAAVNAIQTGQEVVVPCMVGDNMNDLALRRAKLQRLRASLKLLDYNPKRDFVGFGGDDFFRLAGMPGFSHYCVLGKVDADAQSISCADLDGDNKPDLCLFGSGKSCLFQNGGDAFVELLLPPPGAPTQGGALPGCRAAIWADYNGDGKPDLLLAGATGPKLYTNLGGTFRDDTALLPREPYYNLTAAAWLDYDGDGRPDLLFGNGFHGLRLYRNRGKADLPAPPPPPGKPPAPPLWFEDVSLAMGLGPDGVGSHAKGDTLTICDVNGDGRPDFLYGAGAGQLFLHTTMGYVLAKDSGIAYQAGKAGPVFGDIDNDGLPDLLMPQTDGVKLFRNEGKGRFRDMSDKTGDLRKSIPFTSSVACGDFDNDGKLDIVVGCLRGPNRYFRGRGDGTFDDATEAIGLHQRVFSTHAVALIDCNQDGMLDMVFHNGVQESVVLIGNLDYGNKLTPVMLHVAGPDGVVGSKVSVLDPQGKLVASQQIGTSEGRGGQRPTMAHFALKPGDYKVEVRYSSGVRRARDITVAAMPLRAIVNENAAKVE